VTKKEPIRAPKLRGLAVILALLAALFAAAPALAQSHEHEGGGPHGGGMRGHGGPWGHGPDGHGPYGHGPFGPGPYGRGGPRWDRQRFNGYWSGGRWFYGAPAAPLWDAPGFRPGFVPWRRGEYLPQDYWGFVVADPWRFHLRRPPFGYQWVQVGGEFLLVSASTGLIFDVVVGY
jgi:Ni/Co efflux regulator RcnB